MFSGTTSFGAYARLFKALCIDKVAIFDLKTMRIEVK